MKLIINSLSGARLTWPLRRDITADLWCLHGHVVVPQSPDPQTNHAIIYDHIYQPQKKGKGKICCFILSNELRFFNVHNFHF